MKTPTLFAALDLHSSTSVLGTLSPGGTHSKPIRFPTNTEQLLAHVKALGCSGVRLTLEASPLARWAVKLLRPHVEQLLVTERSSDNKPLGYQRIDRRGNNELKNLSYHAWRTACKSTTGDNPVRAFYHASLQRTGSIRNARLNTQRKILQTLWLLWLRNQEFDPKRFFPTPTRRPGLPVCKGIHAPMIP